MQADADKANSTTQVSRAILRPGDVADYSQTLEALNELISAGNVWDSAINEAIMLIENEERRYAENNTCYWSS